jgi:hypothetical protein
MWFAETSPNSSRERFGCAVPDLRSLASANHIPDPLVIALP